SRAGLYRWRCEAHSQLLLHACFSPYKFSPPSHTKLHEVSFFLLRAASCGLVEKIFIISLIPQRFACLQHMGETLLCPFGPAQTDECIAFEVEQIFSAPPGWASQVSAGHHFSDLQADQCIVI